MTKEQVIRIRTALKGNHNLPIRVYIDNVFACIDESNYAQYTKWDDDNETLWSFRLPDPQMDRMPRNRGQAVSLFAVPYDNIQAMEAAAIPLDKPDGAVYADINDVFDTLADAGCTISDEFKQAIICGFKDILKLGSTKASITATDINDFYGPSTVNYRDDWYNGKYAESKKETLYNKNPDGADLLIKNPDKDITL
jgi:hypothetical protein